MKTEKIYTLKKEYKGRETLVTGTLEYLTDYFGYTLEIGRSYDRRILLRPKTIVSLLSNLRKSLDIKEGSCYERTFIEQVK